MSSGSKINVGFVCCDNPYDRRTNSGTAFNTFQALKQQKDLNIIWIQLKQSRLLSMFILFLRVLRKIGIANFTTRCILYQEWLQQSIDKSLIEKTDVLFCPFTQLIKDKTLNDKKIIYCTDAVYHSMIDYYWPIPSDRIKKMGNDLQQKALDDADALIFSSNWSANDAERYYHQPKEKINIIEYGANIDEQDIIPHKYQYNGHLDILFLGVDWERKGGDIAVDAVKWLNNNGIPSTLHIIGTEQLDESIKICDYIDFIGFLDKNDKQQYNRLLDVIKTCHCLLLPTKAECSAIAFCESSAYGLPIFSHITGGVPNYVIDGINGYLLSLGSSGEDFGRKIKDSLESGELEVMSTTAVDLYSKKLNWNCWGKSVSEVIKRIY